MGMRESGLLQPESPTVFFVVERVQLCGLINAKAINAFQHLENDSNILEVKLCKSVLNIIAHFLLRSEASLFRQQNATPLLFTVEGLQLSVPVHHVLSEPFFNHLRT